MKRNKAMLLMVIWLLVMVSVAASALTLLAADGFHFGGRWLSGKEAAAYDRFARLEQVRSILSEEYYQPVDDETLFNGALKGMMAVLGDAYTFYYTPDEMQEHSCQTEGEYSGVGLLVQNNDAGRIEIIRVYADGPADRAGLRTGDCIVAVGGEAVSGSSAATLNRAVSLLKGENGSAVQLTLLRGSECIQAELVRGEVTINNVVPSMIGQDTGCISIFQFSTGVADDFAKALEDLQDQGAEKLIIDLRSNPGGILDEVVEIADSLLGEGCIVYTLNREGSRKDYYSDEAHCDLPLVILVNDMSASASEILAAAVQDHGRGTVVGQQTYGKGVVQTVVSFEEDGAGMQFTSECYYTPNGNDIHGVGVCPDLCMEAQEGFSNYSGVPDLKNDVQLLAALKHLRGE